MKKRNYSEQYVCYMNRSLMAQNNASISDDEMLALWLWHWHQSGRRNTLRPSRISVTIEWSDTSWRRSIVTRWLVMASVKVGTWCNNSVAVRGMPSESKSIISCLYPYEGWVTCGLGLSIALPGRAGSGGRGLFVLFSIYRGGISRTFSVCTSGKPNVCQITKVGFTYIVPY